MLLIGVPLAMILFLLLLIGVVNRWLNRNTSLTLLLLILNDFNYIIGFFETSIVDNRNVNCCGASISQNNIDNDDNEIPTSSRNSSIRIATMVMLVGLILFLSAILMDSNQLLCWYNVYNLVNLCSKMTTSGWRQPAKMDRELILVARHSCRFLPGFYCANFARSIKNKTCSLNQLPTMVS